MRHRHRPACRPAFSGRVFCLWLLGRGLAQMEPCARRIPRAARACDTLRLSI